MASERLVIPVGDREKETRKCLLFFLNRAQKIKPTPDSTTLLTAPLVTPLNRLLPNRLLPNRLLLNRLLLNRLLPDLAFSDLLLAERWVDRYLKALIFPRC